MTEQELEVKREKGRDYERRNKAKRNAACRKRYQEKKAEYQATQREYRNTVNGHLRGTYRNMIQRCSHKKAYIEADIKCEFRTSEEFVTYVINILQVDPRGKDCHRVDDTGNYRPGNIEFMEHDEHMELHIALRKVGCDG